MATLYQRGKIWYCGIMVGDKQICRSLKTTNYNTAKKKATILEDELNGVLLSDILHIWIRSQPLRDTNDRNKEGRSIRTLQDTKTFFNSFKDYFKNTSIAKITREDLLIYMYELKSQNLSDTTIGIRLRVIRSVFNYAYKQGITNFQPFRGFQIPIGKINNEYLEKEEVIKLIEAASNRPLYQQFLHFLVRTGCRPGEFYNLRWDDINTKFLTFYGKSGARKFPLLAKVKETLDKIKQLQDSSVEYVYSYEDGKRHYYNSLNGIVKKYMRKAKLKESYKLYTLRHTFASLLVIDGVSIYRVSKLLGHSTITTTEKYYAHLRPENIEVDIDF